MPSLQRRKNWDGRDGRLESEINSSSLGAIPKLLETKKGMRFCRRCNRGWEENSKNCPRCDKPDQMMWMQRVKR